MVGHVLNAAAPIVPPGRLTDQSPLERPLGIEVDVDYRRPGKPRERQAGMDVGVDYGANGKPQPIEEATA